MTIAPEKTAAAVKDPRSLIDAETFDLLVEDVRRYHPVTRLYAERVMEQALVFLVAHSKTLPNSPSDEAGWAKLSPSRSVDVGWHAFILRSKAYVDFCQRLAGRYMHHLPVMNDDIQSGDALKRTVEALVATGYRVDMEFWDATSCCPEGCGYFTSDDQPTNA